MCTHIVRVLAVLALLATAGRAVAAQTSGPSADALTNSDVVKIVKAGLSEEVVIAAIEAAPKRVFDLRPQGLVLLKTAGVSDRIVLVMQGKGDTPVALAQSGMPASPRTTPVKESSEELREDGIYVGQRGQLTLVEPTVARASGVSAGSMAINKLSFGFKRVQAKAYIPGTSAGLRVPTAPEFYFHGQEFNPNKFLLVRLEADATERKVVVGEAGGLAGAKSGVRKQDIVDVDVTRVRPGLYKVSPRGGLRDGEYGFVNQGDRDDNQVYEFGVD